MVKKLLITILLIVSILCIGCKKEKQNNLETSCSGMLEGVMNYYYYFNDEGIYIANSDRIMYSDWNKIDFDYVCTDPVCMHKEYSCTAYAIDDEKRREDRSSFVVAYEDKMVIFEKYNVDDREEIDEKITRYNAKYYIDVYVAEADGSNRKLQTTIEGTTDSNIMYNGVIVHKGKVWFGGVKEVETISVFNKGDIGEGYFQEEITYSDAVYSIDLNDCKVMEYGLEKDKKCQFDTVSFLTDKDNVYAIKQCFESKKISVFRINSENNCEFLFSENETDMFIVGLLGDRLYYADEKKLYYRKLSDASKRQEFEVKGADNMINSFIVGDKLAVLTDCEWDGEIIKKCNYTFFDVNGNEIKKCSYDEYFTFFQVIGDRVIFTKPFSDKQMWWTDIDNVENIFDEATYIGTFVGAEHDILD